MSSNLSHRSFVASAALWAAAVLIMLATACEDGAGGPSAPTADVIADGGGASADLVAGPDVPDGPLDATTGPDASAGPDAVPDTESDTEAPPTLPAPADVAVEGEELSVSVVWEFPDDAVPTEQAGPVDFRVLRRPAGAVGDHEPTVVAASTGGEPSFVDGDLLLGETYEYAVQAWSGDTQSPLSAWHAGAATRAPADWTLIYFIASDGDYVGYDYWFNIDGLQRQGGSTERVNVIALYDGFEAGDSVYVVVGDSDATTETFPVPTDGGEVNMGDPASYRGLVDWMLPRYTARHYLLSFHDHGGGAIELSYGPDGGPIDGADGERKQKSMLYDTGSRDSLDPDEQGAVVQMVAERVGRKVDVVESMTCLGQMMENTYPMVGAAHFHVGAESLSYVSDTFPVTFLAQHPNSTAEDIARFLVHDHHTGMLEQGTPCHWSMIALDLLPELAEAMAEFARAAQTWLAADGDAALLRDLASESQSFSYDGTDVGSAYLDIRDLARVFAEEPALPDDLRTAAQRMMDAVDDDLVPMNTINSAVHPGTENHADYTHANGLSVYHPNARRPFYDADARPPYEGLSFATATGWADYVESLAVPVPTGPCPLVDELSAEVQADGSVRITWRYDPADEPVYDAFFCSRDDRDGFTGEYQTIVKTPGTSQFEVVDRPVTPGEYRWRVTAFRSAAQEESMNWSATEFLRVD